MWRAPAAPAAANGVATFLDTRATSTSGSTCGMARRRAHRPPADRPRLGGTGVPSQKGTSIIDLMAEETLDRQGRVLARACLSTPPQAASTASNCCRRPWSMTTAARSTNTTTAQSGMVDDLKQSDLCCAEYTGLGTEKDALKDIIDPDRFSSRPASATWNRSCISRNEEGIIEQ